MGVVMSTKSWFEGKAYEKLLVMLDERPAEYFRLVSSVLPKDVKADIVIGDRPCLPVRQPGRRAGRCLFHDGARHG